MNFKVIKNTDVNRFILCNFSSMFQGFVISDWQGIDRITSPPHANYSYSVQAGVSAGIDMVYIIFISRSKRKKCNCCWSASLILWN
jgi:hypothetical protein